MKKIILFVALATLGMSLNSCSSDDSGSSSSSNSITVKIDGTTTTFDNVDVIVDEEPSDPDVTLRINATKGNNLSESITFAIRQGSTGPDQITAFYYTQDNASFHETSNFFTQTITNSNGSLTGTFSGKVITSGANPIEKTFTDGSFNIKY